MSHRLFDLERAAAKGADAIRAWFEENLLFLRAWELLCKPRGRCACQLCHEPQYVAFAKALEVSSKKALRTILGEIFRNSPHLTIQNASVAWVFHCWLEGSNPGVLIRPISLKAPFITRLLADLSQEKSQKLQNDPVFQRFIADGSLVAEALTYFGLTKEGVFKVFELARYPREVGWIGDFIAKLDSGMPALDLDLPFDQRWQLFLNDRQYRYATAYFRLPGDRPALEAVLMTAPEAREILAVFPDGKVSWNRLKKRVAESLAAR